MEVQKIVDDVQGINGGLSSRGTLRLSEFHLVFYSASPPATESQLECDPPRVRESWIPYPMLLHCVFRPTLPSSVIRSSLRLRCRDFTFVAFTFKTADIAREVFEFIKSRTYKLGAVNNLYAFRHTPLKTEKAINGWHLYDARAEFRRQGVSEKASERGWRISQVNCDYSLCDTYPALLVVPSNVSDNVLKYAKEFRSRNRIPVLTYVHSVNNCTITRSSQPLSGITRKGNVQDEKLVAASFSAATTISDSQSSTPVSSQPASVEPPQTPPDGESFDIEQIEDSIISCSAEIYDEKTGRRLIYGAQQYNLIVDARPTINAMLNQVQGFGSENMDKYKFARKVFLSIENIHVMRNSLAKVIEAIKDADLSSLPPDRDLLAQSNWLKHIHDILDGASMIARQVGIKHANVLIHCSDGWDRTSQLSALSQLMLDPYYRTIDGFIVLVEKDWLSFGHMFRLRSGPLGHESWFTVQRDALAGAIIQPGDNDGRGDAFQNAIASAKRFFNHTKEDSDIDPASGETSSGRTENDEATMPKMVSPVFHQFLDSLYQLVRQHSERFEYNERFLRRLLYHLYSCQYGTFLFNSEKQRHDASAQQRTLSVWDYFLSRRSEFTNPEYDGTVDDHIKGRERIILPKLKDIRWWHQLFNRTDAEMNAAFHATSVAETDRASTTAATGMLPSSRRGSAATAKPTTPSSELNIPLLSVLTATETAETTLPIPNKIERSLRRSSSADSPSTFNSMRDGFAGFSLAMLGGNRGGISEVPVSTRTDRELREMT